MRDTFALQPHPAGHPKGIKPNDKFSQIESEEIFDGGFYILDRVTVRSDGNDYTRDVIRHPGAVAIVAITTDGKIILESQYRTPMGGNTIEIPAGKRDEDEPLEVTAQRELKEEKGYVAKDIQYLTALATMVALFDEYLYIFLAEDVEYVGAETEGPEEADMEVMLVDPAEAIEMCLDGRIIDSKSIVGILSAARKLNW